MGFTNVKVLYLPDNFGADWADKVYPVEKGNQVSDNIKLCLLSLLQNPAF